MSFIPVGRPWLQVVRSVTFVCLAGVLLPVTMLLTSCGSNSPTPAIGSVPTITSQPAAQSTPLGQTATFTVVATGTAPLQYQWSKNGTPISGATLQSYTTPDVVAADEGSSFTVMVSNNQGSVTSNPALLSVGPRTPHVGDWRFQGMDLPTGTPTEATNILSFQTETFPNALGSPFNLGLIPGFNCASAAPADCAWTFFVSAPPAGTTWPSTIYRSDLLSNLDTDLTAMASPNIVITSLDLEPANQVFAVSSLQTSAPDGFEYASHTVSPDQIATAAMQEGALGRVVTALSFDASGNAFIVSYGWQNNSATVYETSVIATTSTDSDTVAAAFTSVASQGYIITALGGDPAHGLVIIGTRVRGDSLPRPIVVFTQSGQQGNVSNSLQSMGRNVHTTGSSFFVGFSEQ